MFGLRGTPYEQELELDDHLVLEDSQAACDPEFLCHVLRNSHPFIDRVFLFPAIDLNGPGSPDHRGNKI